MKYMHGYVDNAAPAAIPVADPTDRGPLDERSLAGAWLPVVDNLDAALRHARAQPLSPVDDLEALLRQALGVLAVLGFPRRRDEDSPFDPTCHRAVGTVETGGLLAAGTVVHVVRPGYGYGERQLRRADVVVATDQNTERSGEETTWQGSPSRSSSGSSGRPPSCAWIGAI
jgi:molecular chaperone GrpE